MELEALRKYLDSLPCRGCQVDRVVITDDAVACKDCHRVMSGDYMHHCRTGHWNQVCGSCNEKYERLTDTGTAAETEVEIE